MKDIKNKLKEKLANTVDWVLDHPVETALVATAVIGMTTKLLNAVAANKNAKTWEREVERRERKSEAARYRS